MSVEVDVRTGEVVGDVTALVTAASVESMVKESDRPLLAMMSTMDKLDWRELKPHQTAILLMQKPFMAQGGGTMYLSFKQSILFATRCYELGVSPFSSEVWFDPNRASVNLTLEGKRQLLRTRNIDTGPPSFEDKTRKWEDLPSANKLADELKKLGYPADSGITCKMRVGDPKHAEYVTYTAWLSEWYVPKSPVWQNKPIHMLQTRAVEKAISLVLGTGSSDPISDE